MTGEQTNCMSAHTKPNHPVIVDARAIDPTFKRHNEGWQHRHDQAERQHVERNGDEDERECRASSRP